jgi:hypothetical protein
MTAILLIIPHHGHATLSRPVALAETTTTKVWLSIAGLAFLRPSDCLRLLPQALR